MASVAFEDVTKRFGSTVAVDHLTLDVDDREFMVLLGPSGCGKTTALRMVAGLEAVTDGKVRIDGEVVNDVDPRKRDLAMVFQSYALYPHLSVAKNIESPLLAREHAVDGASDPRKLTKTERRERVTDAARILGLTSFLDRKPAALSGGQRQRVALARAIVTRPRVYLMDEPLSNLDAKLRAQTRTELVELHRRFSTTVLYVTHDQVEAMTMATRIAVMDVGRLQQVGTPREIYEKPANLFVARFIGTPPMDTLDAVVSDGGATALTVRRQTVPAPTLHTGRLEAGKPVVIGVRPEHLVVVPVGDATEGPRLVGRVVNVEWLGHESLIVVDVEGQWVTVRQTAGLPVPEANTEVALTARPDQIHLFDAETTERVE